MKQNLLKPTSRILLVLALLFLFWQQGRAQTVDGTISANEYGNQTDGFNKQGNVYMKWDDTNLYVGITNADINEGAVIYIDKNPLSIINGGTNADGSLLGQEYNGTNFSALPFRADFVSYLKQGYQEYRTANGSNGWSVATTGFGSFAASASMRELSIPWSTMGGKPASFAFFVYVTSPGGWVYNQVPTDNAGGAIGTSASYFRYFMVDDTGSSFPFANSPVRDQVGWANVQFPQTATLIKNSTAATVFMQVYKSGVTNYEGKGAGIGVWLGVSSENTNPATWTEDKWKPAAYYKDAGNNDEYNAVVLGDGLSAGTYYYATRVRYAANPYQYGGYNAASGGFWNGTTNVSGVLTVQDYTGTLFSSASPSLTSIPSFPTVNDNITINFDAALGNVALKDLAGNMVYAHTGISTPAGDWQCSTTWLDNTSNYLFTHNTGNTYTLSIPNVFSYYNVPTSTDIQKISFVLRNADGAKQAKTVDNKDFSIQLYAPNQLHLRFNYPTTNLIVRPNDQISIQAESNSAETLKLYVDNVEVNTTAGLLMNYNVNAGAVVGSHVIKVVASQTGFSDVTKTISYYVTASTVSEALPASMKDGINYIDANTVTLVIYAPQKQYIHLIGDFNNWEVNNSYLLKRTPDNLRYWITLTGLEAGKEYGFQYLIDGTLRIADPYTDKILDPDNDKYIPTTVYPDMKPYPTGKTEEITSVLQTGKTPYNWEVPAFTAPAQNQLVIYELHIRDFTETRDINGVTKKLDYLKTLGINAIELMPINEFEGNDSWGYNPSFYFAPDKAYGTAQAYKQFVDACHKKGIAVLIDMVLNHSFNQSPMVRMYFDKVNDRPAPENPWFNVTAPNTSYSWGSDFNHERQTTKDFVDRVNAYWLTEYKVDGIRFDFTKGFTQTVGSGDAYDASRIAILKRMYNSVKAVNPHAYVILEHLTENSEEVELANYGIMLWGNMNGKYNEALSGWNNAGNSNLSNAYYKNKNFTYANLVSYAESHDEERNPYNALTYGNSFQAQTYDVKNKSTYVNRTAMTEAFNLFMPGPRMLWQFEELAYDYSINENGRTGRKPIRWDYFDDADRQSLYTRMAKMIQYRKENPTIFDWKIDYAEDNSCKRIRYIDPNDPTKINAVVIGNFGVTPASFEPGFGVGGLSWFDIISGTSLGAQTIGNAWSLAPGEFRVLVREGQTINYTQHPPIGDDSSITINEDSPKTFSSSDFKFYSVDGKTMSGLKIVSVPNAGSFRYDNANISAGAEIADLTKLTFTPALNANGTGYASFSYQLEDNTTPGLMLSEKTYTTTINVTPVNDPPVITDQQPLSVEENASLTISLSNLTVTDPDNTYPIDFTLTVADGLNYTRVGNTITPNPYYSGTLTVPVTVSDGTSNSNTFNLTVTVTQNLQSISPTDVQTILPSTNGTVLTVSETPGSSSKEWKYKTSPTETLVSFVPAVTSNTYTPNFSQSGSYYVVCVSTINGQPYTSNAVQVNVRQAQTINFGVTQASYGDIDFAPATASSGLTVTLSVPDANTVATIVNNKVHIIGVGAVELTATQAGDDNYNPAPEVKQTLTVSKKDQSITFDALPAKTYGDAAFDLSGTAGSGLSVSYSSSNSLVATIVGKTVSIVGAGTAEITAIQLGDGNYNAAPELKQTLTVNKKDQSITFDALPTKTYGDAAFDLSVTAGSGLAVSYASSNSLVATIVGKTVSIVGAGTAEITATQLGDENYNEAPEVKQTLTVNKKDQSITFDALATKTYGDAVFDLSGTVGSGLAVSYASSNTLVATIEGKTVSIVGAGTAEITATQLGDGNYNAAPEVKQTLTVSKKDQSITFDALPTKAYVDPAFNLSATAGSGLAVSYASSNSLVATIVGKTVSIVGAGTAEITATQSGDGNYNEAQEVKQTLTVSKKDQSITFDALPAKTYGDPDFDLSGTAGSGLSVSYASSNTLVATIVGKTVSIVGAGTAEITATQSGDGNYNEAQEVKQTLTVNKKDQSITFDALPAKTYGDPAFDLSATAGSGLAVSYFSSNTLVATIVGKTVSIVGAGTAEITATQSGNANYNAAPELKQTLTVNVTTGIGVSQTDKIEVYPVPTNNFVTIKMSMSENKPVRYTLYNQNGKAVMTNKVSEDKFDINLKYLSKGVYYLELLSATNRYIYKIVLI
jgi:1,4-alpha-glucan branching enzyme/NifU-like protein involved in Fe-S cluster formation